MALPSRPLLSFVRSGDGTPHLVVGGQAGQSYVLESATDMRSNWDTWLSFALGGAPLDWSENILTDGPERFFRVRSIDPNALQDSVTNFRLLDAQGVSHDLYYHTDMQATVVLTAGTDLGNIAGVAPIFNELATRYASTMQFWILLSDPAPDRASVIARAQDLKLTAPVLLDVSGLAGLMLGVSHAGEVAVVQPPIFTLAYRGAVAGSGQQTADQSYLGQALAGLASSSGFTFTRTPPGGTLLNFDSTVPDYSRDVAPILYKQCAICHRPNDVAPFAMTNYSVIQEWAPAMKYMVMSGKMPPWHVDPQYGHWGNDLSLAPQDKATLVRWLNAGAPRGSGSDPLAELPVQPSYNQWPPELGEPDALVTIPSQGIKATGTEAYRYIFVQTPNPTNVWLKAAVIRPSNYRAVHHYLVWLGKVGNGSPIPGVSTYQTSIAGYAPGWKPFIFPDGTGVSLGASNWLTFNLHYTPYGEATNDQPVLALWYHKTPPAKNYESVSVQNLFFTIPAGANDYGVTANWTATKPTTLYRLNPHMHLRGKRMSFQLTYPNGQKETVLSVPDYNFSWQVGYQLSPPKDLPTGTKLTVSGAFDNTALNLSNPDPNSSVSWGDQSWNEMFVGFIDITQ